MPGRAEGGIPPTCPPERTAPAAPSPPPSVGFADISPSRGEIGGVRGNVSGSLPRRESPPSSASARSSKSARRPSILLKPAAILSICLSNALRTACKPRRPLRSGARAGGSSAASPVFPQPLFLRRIQPLLHPRLDKPVELLGQRRIVLRQAGGCFRLHPLGD